MAHNKKEKKIMLIKRRKNAPPEAEYTKGYYRFSKDFPSVTDKDGYRDNEVFISSGIKKSRQRRILAVVCFAVFIIAVIGTTVGYKISSLPVVESEESTDVTSSDLTLSAGTKAVYLTGDTLSFSGVESLIQTYKKIGVNTVVIDFKSPDGYIYFRPSISVVTEALYRVSENASETVKEFQNAGIKVFASVSCFADDIYARNHSDLAAYTQTEPQSGNNASVNTLWYDGSSDSHAWLSPYSNEIRYYINTIISDIASMGVDGILLNHVSLPFASDNTGVKYIGMSDGEVSAEQKMADVVSDINASLPDSCTVMAEVDGEKLLNEINGNTAPAIFSTECQYIVPTVKLSAFSKNVTIAGKVYPDATKAPYVAMLNLMSEFTSHAKSSDCKSQFMPIIEASESSASEVTALKSVNITSYIMYDSEMKYSAANFSDN